MTLKLFSSTKKELQILEEKANSVEQRIIAEQHKYFLDSSGLRPFLQVLNDNETVFP